jgi:nucleotide-binding universal stress UspA family protein
MKTILVPTDFSAEANNALDFAIELAKREKAKIILLHAFNITYISPDMPIEYFDKNLLEEKNGAAKILLRSQNKIKKHHLECDVINKRGDAVDMIIDITHKKKIDLVVMGTKGASGLKEIFMGSHTADVISHVNCPVIAIPKRASSHTIKKIVFATDYHSSDINALKKLAAIASIFRSKITVLHISDEEYTREHEEAYIERFTAKVKQKINYRYISHDLIYGYDIEEELETYLRKNRADILAISTKHRNLFERIFGSSITKKLAYHTKIPMIVFHYKQESVVFI